MDLDAYVETHQGEWARLEHLVRAGRLSGIEADELIDLYQRTATHLSVVRSAAPDPALVGRLSRLVARARATATGSSDPAWRDVVRFLGAGLPAVIYRARWWWLGAMAVSLAASVVLGAWVAEHPGVQTSLVPASTLHRLVDKDFQSYYSTFPAGSFAAHVWTNNAWIAATCIAFGILGVPVVLVLWANTVNLGIVGGIMIGHGRAGLFFSLILPHGMLELTSVFVAAGTGLRLFWAWVCPGARTRAQALAQEGRAAAATVVGLIGTLAVSGCIEAFVTPSGLPTADTHRDRRAGRSGFPGLRLRPRPASGPGRS